jgi:hypothetical protein
MPANVPMPKLPRLTSAKPQDIKNWANALVDALELQIRRMNAPAGAAWTVTNLTPSNALNGGTATLLQTSEALGTLIVALQNGGVVP